MLEADAIKVIEGMSTFMENTNQMLAQLKMSIDNQQIDIDKLNKKLNHQKKLIEV